MRLNSLFKERLILRIVQERSAVAQSFLFKMFGISVSRVINFTVQYAALEVGFMKTRILVSESDQFAMLYLAWKKLIKPSKILEMPLKLTNSILSIES